MQVYQRSYDDSKIHALLETHRPLLGPVIEVEREVLLVEPLLAEVEELQLPTQQDI